MTQHTIKILFSEKSEKKMAQHVFPIEAQSKIFGHFINKKAQQSTWIIGVLYLDGNLSKSQIKDTFWKPIIKIPRFRSILKLEPFKNGFYPMPDETIEANVDYHIQYPFDDHAHSTVSESEKNKVISELASWHFDASKPLWRLIVIPNLESGKTCVISQINHAIADGISSVYLLLSMSDEYKGLKNNFDQTMLPKKRRRSPGLPLASSITSFLAGTLRGLTLPFARHDPPNILRIENYKQASLYKNCATSSKIALYKLKEMKNKLEQATINDLMLTLLAMTLRAFFKEKGDLCIQKKTSQLRAMFPINLRNAHDGPFKYGSPFNKWMYGMIPLILNQEIEPIDLFWKIKWETNKAKKSPSAYIQALLTSILVHIMPAKLLVDRAIAIANTGTVTLSNIPGPEKHISIGNQNVSDIKFYLYSPISVYIGVMSYADEVSISVNLDSSLEFEAEDITKHWTSEFQAFYNIIMDNPNLIQCPWQKTR